MQYQTKIATPEADQKVYQAVEVLLQRIKERKLTGSHTIQVDSNQGGVTKTKINTEEQV